MGLFFFLSWNRTRLFCSLIYQDLYLKPTVMALRLKSGPGSGTELDF